MNDHRVQVASAQPVKLHTQHIITADITTQQPTASVGENDLTIFPITQTNITRSCRSFSVMMNRRSTSKRNYLPIDMTSRDSTLSKTAVRTQFTPYTMSICNEPPIHDLSAIIHGTGNGVWCNMNAEHSTNAAMSASCTKVFSALRFRYSHRM